MADLNHLRAGLAPVLDDIVKRSTVAERFVHRDAYRITIATLWTNLVLRPEDAGIAETDLEAVHDLLNADVQAVLGADEGLASCFAFINSKQGEAAMKEAKLTQTHRELLLYFCSMILDPEGHRKWMARVRENMVPRR